MAAHTKLQREFIVRKLAAFETPKAIAAAFAARFPDTSCGEADVLATDPRIVVVDPDLHTLFAAERERVLLDVTLAPMAEQRARLIVLSRQVEIYLANNDLASARTVLRQIAEEQGVVGGKAGKDAKLPDVPQEAITEIRRTIVYPPNAEPK